MVDMSLPELSNSSSGSSSHGNNTCSSSSSSSNTVKPAVTPYLDSLTRSGLTAELHSAVGPEWTADCIGSASSYTHRSDRDCNRNDDVATAFNDSTRNRNSNRNTTRNSNTNTNRNTNRNTNSSSGSDIDSDIDGDSSNESNSDMESIFSLDESDVCTVCGEACVGGTREVWGPAPYVVPPLPLRRTHSASTAGGLVIVGAELRGQIEGIQSVPGDFPYATLKMDLSAAEVDMHRRSAMLSGSELELSEALSNDFGSLHGGQRSSDCSDSLRGSSVSFSHSLPSDLLIICDGCECSFHPGCLGMTAVPPDEVRPLFCSESF